MPDTTPTRDAAKPEEAKKPDEAKPGEGKKPEEPITGKKVQPHTETPPPIQPTVPAMTYADLTPIVMIILLAGILGGVVNTALGKKEEETGRNPWVMNILIGIGAAFLVPLFLKSVDSKILDTLHIDPINGLLLFSYCTLASISARHFITSITEQVFKKIDTIKKEAETTKQELNKTKEEVEKAKSASQSTTNLALALNDAARLKTVDLLTTRTPAQNHPVLNLSDAAFQDLIKTVPDPWKGRFGNVAEQNSRKLEVKLHRVPEQNGLAVLNMTVTSTDTTKPLTGKVQFFLHPTFQNFMPEVDVVDGKATLRLISFGAFTVGVLCDADTTRLELDLSKIPDAWEPWKSR